MGAQQNKPLILTKQDDSKQKVIPDSISQVLLILVTKEVLQIYIDTKINGQELKQLIYQRVSKILNPKDMLLKLNGKKIEDDHNLNNILSLNDVITQNKIPLNEVSKIDYFSQIQDEVSLEKGVAKMPCGHLMGRQSMISLLQCVASQKKWQICCPFCDKQWDYTFCRKIAGLTKQQDKYFSTKFSDNWLEIFTKKCPGCGTLIEKKQQSTCNKVKCSNKNCKYSYFCFLCLKPWISKNYQDCGNDACNLYKNYPQLRQMKQINLFQQKQEGPSVQIIVYIPIMRLCPTCNLPIEHLTGCKHMKCYNCKNQFCWVCLNVFKKQWLCGSYNQYCGSVAPIQSLK